MLANRNPKTPPHTVEGRVLYLLVLVVFVQSIYPITANNSPLTQIIYNIFYASLLVVSIVVTRESPFITQLLTVLAAVWLAVGLLYAFQPHLVWLQLVVYLVVAAFQTTVTWTLVHFVFNTHRVSRDVIYAACAVYLLLGAIFVPIYGTIETLHFGITGGEHAFKDPLVPEGQPFPWQTFIYYSYTTLTTLGYGDVLPVSMWARSAANLQAVIGVLYTAIVISRLVGLYAGQEVEDYEEARHTPETQTTE